MKILLLDIETAPNLAYVWGLWNQNISPHQLENSGYVLCWSAKWYGKDHVYFDSVKKSSPERMLSRIHRLVDEADVLVHYNGKKFDIPTLNKEWIKYGFSPPAPSRHIDLLDVCRRKFKFVSNKLDYVSQYLDIGKKVRHTGHELWVGCMRGDKEAWKMMEEYNKQDVLLLEALYEKLVPWIDSHPSHSAETGVLCCPKCGSEEFIRRGFAFTLAHKYPRYKCKRCNGWFRGNKTLLSRAEERGANIQS